MATLILGSYTSRLSFVNGASEGVEQFNEDTNKYSTLIQKSNPSFIVKHTINTDQYLYIVEEIIDNIEFSQITVLKQENEIWNTIQVISTKGKAGCYILIHKNRLWCTNYGSGSVSVFNIELDGKLEWCTSISFDQYGDSTRPHCIEYLPLLNKYCVALLGIDTLTFLSTDKGHIKIDDSLRCLLPKNSGPRHLSYYEKINKLYVISEFSNQLFVMDPYDNGLKIIQEVPTIRDTTCSESYASELKLDTYRNILYASNRGEDTIAVFQIETTGRLNYIDSYTSFGCFPRHFEIDIENNSLWIANQNSNSIVKYEIKEKGGLEFKRIVEGIRSPACIVIK